MIDDTSDTHERSLDWPDAEYGATAAPSAGVLAWTVRHTLTGAPGIEGLLDSGYAAWCVEARCAETLCTITETSREPLTAVALSPRDVGAGIVHLWPGVITVVDCALDPTGTNWGDRPIPLSPGRYLARGAPLRVEHQGSDPMLFIAEPTMEPKTSVSIKVEEIGQDSRFVVRAHPDRIDRLKYDEATLLSCWATALGMLPSHNAFDIEEDDTGQVTVPGSQVGDLILRQLLAVAPNVPLWDSASEWDPMRAASAFVPLHPSPTQDLEE